MLGPVAMRFVEAYPADAARVLEPADPGIVADVLSGAPASAGAALLRAMLPDAAAQTLGMLPAAAAAGPVSHLPAELAAPLLLRLGRAERAALTKALPARASARLSMALRFPSGSVGSLIDPDVVTVRPETTVAEAVEVARRAPEALRKYLYVLDEDHRLAGVVDARDCVLQDAGRPMREVQRTGPVALRAGGGLRQASLLEAWERFDVLPATDRRGVFLGVVRRAALLRAIAEPGGAAPKDSLGGLALDLAELYWRTAFFFLAGPANEDGEAEAPPEE